MCQVGAEWYQRNERLRSSEMWRLRMRCLIMIELLKYLIIDLLKDLIIMMIIIIIIIDLLIRLMWWMIIIDLTIDKKRNDIACHNIW